MRQKMLNVIGIFTIIFISILILIVMRNSIKTVAYYSNTPKTYSIDNSNASEKSTVVVEKSNVSESQEENKETNDNQEQVKSMNVYKKVMATVFWVGEAAGRANDNISNYASAWDSNWEEHFGGIDSPKDRCGYNPCEFIPNENPFYFALPYNDIGYRGKRKDSAQFIPWFESRKNYGSVVKNVWVEIKHKNNICYGQWEDVGPNEEDDFDYVFGDSEPINTFGLKAGIDLSPALRDCINMKGNDFVEWRFVSDNNVPNGPWKNRITTSDMVR